jgi:hypothetical protein
LPWNFCGEYRSLAEEERAGKTAPCVFRRFFPILFLPFFLYLGAAIVVAGALTRLRTIRKSFMPFLRAAN